MLPANADAADDADYAVGDAANDDRCLPLTTHFASSRLLARKSIAFLAKLSWNWLECGSELEDQKSLRKFDP